LSSQQHNTSARGSACTAVLDWGQAHYGDERFDLVIGADVVASLYDPYALARTIHSLANVAVISFKERLSSVHRDFEEHMASFYESINIIQPTGCRNRNPNVQIMIAKGRKSK
jgi:nicotinic acid mononucleotide adenylyltransferase